MIRITPSVSHKFSCYSQKVTRLTQKMPKKSAALSGVDEKFGMARAPKKPL